MIPCSNCGKENANDARFCQNCGQSLEISCGDCGTKNDADANFCKNCGHRLAGDDTAPAVKQETDSKPSESERRFVTILFCDIVGSTSIAERLDPEVWTEIMNGVFERLIPQVTRYGGTPSRLLGDAVLALFGAPVAHEDDPYRAVLAALGMLEKFKPYRQQVRERLIKAGVPLSERDFNIRIGLNTGLAIVGDVGAGEKLEYTAMGDAVNLAARMEQTAVPGTIQISYDTYLPVQNLVELEALEPVSVKGKRKPIQTYRVIGPKAAGEQRQAFGGLESPLVGRLEEMAQLANVLPSLETGKGQIVCLIGEGGLGKSRLVAELQKKRLASQVDVSWTAAESYSFENSQPYGLIQRLLRRVGGIAQEDSQDAIGRKISRLVSSLAPDERARTEGMIRMLFGLETEDGKEAVEGKALEIELPIRLRELLTSWAGARPAIMVLEDLHWSDSASIELIKQLLPVTEGVPLALICVFRPDRQSTIWNLKQEAENKYPNRYQEITLRPLSTRAIHDLASNLLEISDLPENLGELIAEKTAGVPYFIEEIVSDLIERGVLVRAVDGKGWQATETIDEMQVPDSLEAVLASRMDRLEPMTRRTLQLAAVIGRSFHYPVLKMVVSLNGRLEEQLQKLQQAGMIYETAPVPDPQYMFHHVLLQEAAYNTILISSRRQYHRRVGEAMEEIFGDHLEEQAALLAYHFDRAGEEIHALPYYKAAADSAQRLFANEQALAHYQRAIAIAGALKPADPVLSEFQEGELAAGEILRRLHESVGDLQIRLGDYAAAYDHYAQSYSMLSADRPLDQARLQINIGDSWLSRYQFEEGEQAYTQAENLLESFDDHGNEEWRQLWVQMKMSLADSYYWQRRWVEMSAICDQLQEPIQQYGTLRQQASFFGLRAMLINRREGFGPNAESLEYSRKGLELAEQIGSKEVIAGKIFGLGHQLLWNFKLEEAKQTLAEALVLAQEIGDLMLQNRVISYLIITLRFLGDETGVRRNLEKAQTTIEEEGTVLYKGTSKANFAWLAYRSAAWEEAEEQALAAVDCWQDIEFPIEWLARLPLLAIGLENGELETAVQQAEILLRPDQQTILEPIIRSLTTAVEAWAEEEELMTVQALQEAVTRAKEHGYL